MAGHDISVTLDANDLHLGDNIVDFINKGIDESDYTVILFSTHSDVANWQKVERDAAIWSEIQNKKGKCLVVRIDQCEIPPIFGPKLFYDSPTGIDSDRKYADLTNKICTVLRAEHAKASVTLSKALALDTDNPFRHIRAEHFDKDPNALVQAFAPLDSLKMGKFHDMHPCFLEGPRGTGKSMLLLSIRARNILPECSDSTPQNLIFGFYLKLSPGPICHSGVQVDSIHSQTQRSVNQEDIPALVDISYQEIVLSLCESLVSELEYCLKNSLIPVTEVEQRLSNSISTTLFSETSGSHSQVAHSFPELRDKLSQVHRKIARYVRYKFTYRQDIEVPVAEFDFDALVSVIAKVKSHIKYLSSAMFVALIDEYENLLPYQQRAINTIVKFATPHFSVKVAKKIGISDSPGTFINQELQETHDYSRILLVYDVGNTDGCQEYQDLLSSIVEKQIGVTHWNYRGIDELLPASNDVQEGLDEEHISGELNLMDNQRRNGDTITRENGQDRIKKNHYRQAAIYRVIANTPGRTKHFSGFKKLAFISSGIIRYFQEILGVAYYLTSTDSRSSGQDIYLPPTRQSEAVHIVSDNALTTLSKNVETYGETLKIMLIDLGGCIRQKLLKHVSEPEAARVTIIDAELLKQEEFALLRTVLDIGVREGVLQTREGRPAFLPKHGSDPQEVEFNICRVLAPSLQISPRLRWRTRVRATVLRGLVDPDLNRRSVSRNLLLKMAMNTKPSNGSPLQHALEFGNNEDQV